MFDVWDDSDIRWTATVIPKTKQVRDYNIHKVREQTFGLDIVSKDLTNLISIIRNKTKQKTQLMYKLA